MGLFAVTGSAGGIGGAIRTRIEAEGGDVIGVDVQGQEVVADLASAEGRERAADEVARLSGGALDGAVACAGLGGTVRPASLVAKVNYFGAVATLDGLEPLLAKGSAPAAVAICSNSAPFGLPGDQPLVQAMLGGDEARATELADQMDGQAVYSQSKLALAWALRRRSAAWAGKRVRLNAVAPGPVLTPLTQAGLDDPVAGPLIRRFPVPLGRWGEPDEIAGAVWFLLGPESSWIHGQILFVDGGTDAMLRPDSL
jgi:NAD(P)-dependent dehydrogenase (short-subunit alcohol dehydrogenase family)